MISQIRAARINPVLRYLRKTWFLYVKTMVRTLRQFNHAICARACSLVFSAQTLKTPGCCFSTGFILHDLGLMRSMVTWHDVHSLSSLCSWLSYYVHHQIVSVEQCLSELWTVDTFKFSIMHLHSHAERGSLILKNGMVGFSASLYWELSCCSLSSRECRTVILCIIASCMQSIAYLCILYTSKRT